MVFLNGGFPLNPDFPPADWTIDEYLSNNLGLLKEEEQTRCIANIAVNLHPKHIPQEKIVGVIEFYEALRTMLTDYKAGNPPNSPSVLF